MAKRGAVETWTSKVMRELVDCDDFVTARVLQLQTGGSPHQITAALVHLRKHKAVDCVVEPDGVAWWFATPESDDRRCCVEERVPESRPRSPRRSKRR